MSKPKVDMNLVICTECGAKTSEAAEYHPYAFCVLIKAGLDPLTVVRDALREIPPEHAS